MELLEFISEGYIKFIPVLVFSLLIGLERSFIVTLLLISEMKNHFWPVFCTFHFLDRVGPGKIRQFWSYPPIATKF